jgi:hypothetical protein
VPNATKICENARDVSRRAGSFLVMLRSVSSSREADGPSIRHGPLPPVSSIGGPLASDARELLIGLRTQRRPK